MLVPAGVLAPLVLVGVLALSAVAKSRQPDSTLSAMALLRLPAIVRHRKVAIALPYGEGVLALALLSPWPVLARPASWAALALFAIYLIIIARAMTFHPRPSCGCFGRIGDQRVRAKTVWRNALFVLLAVVAAAFTQTGHTVPSTLARLDASSWGWLVAAAAAAAVVALIGPGPTGQPTSAPPQHSPSPSASASAPTTDETLQDGEEYLRTPIPSAALLDPQGDPHTLAEMARDRAQLLVFVNCYCGSTHQALRTVRDAVSRMPQIDVRVVFSSVPVMASTDELSTSDCWRDHGGLTWQSFGMTSSPSAVLLGADGLLAGGPVGGGTAVEEFIGDVEAALTEGSPLRAPEDPLSDVESLHLVAAQPVGTDTRIQPGAHAEEHATHRH